jgi:hypothetical protein
MAAASGQTGFRFLYRQTEGVIDRATWARASVLPLGVALVTTFFAWAITPDTPRDLGTQAFIDPRIIVTHIYFYAYAFVLLICAVAEYFLSAKRFTARGMPSALAGLAPFAILLAGAANWYQPRSEGWAPPWLAYAFDLLALAVIAWNVWELGLSTGRKS